jgi:ADP-ribosylglycohydrolase
MYGTIIGDINGSIYELNNIKSKDIKLFDDKMRFTDDTVLTISVIEHLLSGDDFLKTLLKNVAKYPDRNYGQFFLRWCQSEDHKPYGSQGNGAAVKVASLAYFYDEITSIHEKTIELTNYTHNSSEGLSGSLAMVDAIYLARKYHDKSLILNHIEKYYYSLNFSYNLLVKNYKFNPTCRGSVPEAIYCFLISSNFEDAIKIAISIGGDSDTIAAMTGSIAEAYYGISQTLIDEANRYLPQEFKDTLNKFYSRIAGKKE